MSLALTIYACKACGARSDYTAGPCAVRVGGKHSWYVWRSAGFSSESR